MSERYHQNRWAVLTTKKLAKNLQLQNLNVCYIFFKGDPKIPYTCNHALTCTLMQLLTNTLLQCHGNYIRVRYLIIFLQLTFPKYSHQKIGVNFGVWFLLVWKSIGSVSAQIPFWLKPWLDHYINLLSLCLNPICGSRWYRSSLFLLSP